MGRALQTINLKPYANPGSVTTNQDAGVGVSLLGENGYPAPNSSTLSYSIVNGPSHGTITGFDPAKGILTYMPAPGYAGSDSFQYMVTATGPWPTAPASAEQGRHGYGERAVGHESPLVTPPQIVSASVISTQKLNKQKKPVGPKLFQGFAFKFDAAMNAAAVNNAGHYQVDIKVQKRQGRKKVTVLQPISFSLSFDATSNTLLLKPSGGQKKFTLGGQITLVAAGLTSSTGASLDGNNSGTGGTNAVYNISKGGKVITHA